MDLLAYRQATTNLFLSSCQSLLTTSHSKGSPEPTGNVRIVPGFGTDSRSTWVLNLTSPFAIVSATSVPSLRTRSEGILRLISTDWAILYLLSLIVPTVPVRGAGALQRDCTLALSCCRAALTPAQVGVSS